MMLLKIVILLTFIQIISKTDDDFKLSMTLNKLANLYIKMGVYDKSLQYYNKSEINLVDPSSKTYMNENQRIVKNMFTHFNATFFLINLDPIVITLALLCNLLNFVDLAS